MRTKWNIQLVGMRKKVIHCLSASIQMIILFISSIFLINKSVLKQAGVNKTKKTKGK